MGMTAAAGVGSVTEVLIAPCEFHTSHGCLKGGASLDCNKTRKIRRARPSACPLALTICGRDMCCWEQHRHSG